MCVREFVEGRVITTVNALYILESNALKVYLSSNPRHPQPRNPNPRLNLITPTHLYMNSS